MRGRILQTPVRSELGAVPVMPTLRRWGAFRSFESKLEHIYGRDCAEQILASSYGVRNFTPIAGFPATVYDGCIVPRIGGGSGFTDIADVRARALGGWGQYFRVDKTGNTVGTAGDSRHLWSKPGWPPTGATPAGGGNPPGSNFANPTTGGLNQIEPAGLTLYFLGAQASVGSVARCYVMFDYFWGYNAPWSRGTTSIGPDAPTKYQTTALATGVWLSSKVTTVLDGTAVSWTVHYGDETGTDRTLSAMTVNTVASVHEPVNANSFRSWLVPTTTPGVRSVNSSVLTSTPATGAFDFMLGKNIVCIPAPLESIAVLGAAPTFLDGWQSAFNFAPIPATANLAFLEFSIRGQGGVAGNDNLDNLLLVAA